MKKIVALLLTVTLVMSITIVAYAADLTSEFRTSDGKYSLLSTVVAEFLFLKTDKGSGMTVNNTSNVANYDSRAYVYLQARKSDGSVIKSATAARADTKAIVYLSVECANFRVKSFLLEPSQWKYRLEGSWVTLYKN